MQLNDDHIDEIVLKTFDFIDWHSGINEDQMYEVWSDFLRGLLEPYSNGERNWN